MSILSTVSDPTLLLAAVCLSLPLWDLNTSAERISYLLHPYNIAAVVSLLAVIIYTNYVLETREIRPQTSKEYHISMWWLVNGILFHFLIGGSRVLTDLGFPEYHLHKMMGNIDQRFVIRDPTVQMLTWIEIGIMAPLCTALYYATRARQHWRLPAQLVVSTVQLIGTILYIGIEWYQGFQHFKWVDYHFTFTLNHILYFWLGVVSNLIWIIIPLMFIYSAWNEIVSIVRLNIDNVVSLGPKQFLFSPAAFKRQDGHVSPYLARLQQNSSIPQPDFYGDDDDDDDYHYQQTHSYEDDQHPPRFASGLQGVGHPDDDADEEIVDLTQDDHDETDDEVDTTRNSRASTRRQPKTRATPRTQRKQTTKRVAEDSESPQGPQLRRSSRLKRDN